MFLKRYYFIRKLAFMAVIFIAFGILFYDFFGIRSYFVNGISSVILAMESQKHPSKQFLEQIEELEETEDL